jgi:hypothetical protein
MLMTRIMDEIVDCTVGGSSGGGWPFAQAMEVSVGQVLRVYGTQIDFAANCDGRVVLCNAWTRNEDFAARVAKVLRENSGKSVAQTWAMPMPTD